MKLVKKAAATFDCVISLLAYLAGVLLMFVMLSVCFAIFMRYFLGSAQLWVTEVAEYILVFMTLLAAAWVLKRGGHVTIDMVPDRLNPKSRALLNTITSILCAMGCLTVAWYSGWTTWSNFQRGIHAVRILELPLAPMLSVIPIGTFLFSIQFLRRAYSYLQNWRAL